MKKLVAANWKMYKTQKDVFAFFEIWNSFSVPKTDTAFFPPFPLLLLLKSFLRHGEKFGGQNCSEKKEGAFTGDTSPFLLKDIGCEYVLIGHSERRHVFGEKNEVMGLKLKAAMEGELRPIYCIGEKLEEREADKTIDVVYAQLEALTGLPSSGYDIAYEPVWAIGTGKVAKPEDASSVQGKIKDWLKEKGLGADARILYGGSVKPDNAKELLNSPSVDGLLVGGASLDPESFHKIADAG
jgi:triosephosphate isomerase (TIM)